MTPEEFRKYGHQVIDFIADYRAHIEERPVMAVTTPGEIRERLPKTPPQQAESIEGIMADLDRIVLPGLTHWQHPQFYGYFPSNQSLPSVLGDLPHHPRRPRRVAGPDVL